MYVPSCRHHPLPHSSSNIALSPLPPSQYARSARKWGIGPTEQTTFFTHQGVLLRRGLDHHSKHHGHHKQPETEKQGIFASIRNIFAHRKGAGSTSSGAGTGTSEAAPTSGSGTGSSTEGAEVPAEDVQNGAYMSPPSLRVDEEAQYSLSFFSTYR